MMAQRQEWLSRRLFAASQQPQHSPPSRRRDGALSPHHVAAGAADAVEGWAAGPADVPTANETVSGGGGEAVGAREFDTSSSGGWEGRIREVRHAVNTSSDLSSRLCRDFSTLGPDTTHTIEPTNT